PVALQLYSVRDHTAEDMAGTLRQLAAMGYQGVELAGYGNLTREQLKEVINETSLQVVASHTNLSSLQNELDDIVEESKVFGHRYVVLGSVSGELRGSAANWKEAARILTTIGEKLHQHDLQFCYHNHAFEFEERYDGEYGFDILFSNSDPQFVQSELDSYWVKKGGPEPVDYIKKYSGRIPLLHIKDMRTDGDFAEIGTGTLDWPAIFSAAEVNGVKHYIVEQDTCPGDSLDSVKLSIENLREMGKL
ncbi:MAG: sugar phosphate isomerase/epimerase, partial [Abditibacteriaceae bacterium]